MLAVDQAMTPAPTEQQCNEQTAGETRCPYRMNVPVQRTNGWRSRVPLPNEREHSVPFEVRGDGTPTYKFPPRGWMAIGTSSTAVVDQSLLGRKEVRGGAVKLHTCTPVDKIDLGNSASKRRRTKRSTKIRLNATLQRYCDAAKPLM